MRPLHIPAYEFERQRWSNGLGWTREIRRQPAGAESYVWRASIAEIDHPCGFSRYPGYRRSLVLLEGACLQLAVAGETHELRPPFQRLDFDGEDEVACLLPEGPVRAFNLIYRSRQISAEILPRPLVGPMVFFGSSRQSWLLYLVRGACSVKQAVPLHLTAGDALLLDSGTPDQARSIIEGGGELLLVNLQQPGQP